MGRFKQDNKSIKTDKLSGKDKPNKTTSKPLKVPAQHTAAFPKHSKDILANAVNKGGSVHAKKVVTQEVSESESSDDEPAIKRAMSTVNKRKKSPDTETSPAKKSKTLQVLPSIVNDDSLSSDSDDGSDENPPKPMIGRKPNSSKAMPATARTSDTSDADSESESSGSDDESSVPEDGSSQAKKSSSSSEDSSSESDEVISMQAHSASKQKPQPPEKNTVSTESSSSEDDESDSLSSDSESDEETPSINKNAKSLADKRSKKDAAFTAQGEGKRKSENQPIIPTKKAKLTNGDAAPAVVDQEARSVFVGRLSWNVDDAWLSTEFAECGEVTSARVQMDRNTGKSRGFGYVHFATPEAAQKALALAGKEIDGRPIHVDLSAPADKNKSRENRAKAFGDKPSEPSATLYVGNLSYSTVEDTLYEIFGDYGDIKGVRIPTDRETGEAKGFGYVEFSDIKSAKRAFEAMKGKDVDGRPIRLDYNKPRDGASASFGAWGRDNQGGRGRGFAGRGRGGRGSVVERGHGRGRGRGGQGAARNGGITDFRGKKTTF